MLVTAKFFNFNLIAEEAVNIFFYIILFRCFTAVNNIRLNFTYILCKSPYMELCIPKFGYT